VRSAGVRVIPANCFHTGSARFRLSGLPVLMAIPIRTPTTSTFNVRTTFNQMAGFLVVYGYETS